MSKPPLKILYEDNHLLVVEKPAGLPTQGVAEGTPSVVTRAKAYLKQKYRKPGNVYLGVVSRLDAFVSGVLVLARTSKAATRLTEQFRSSTVSKVYQALVERPPDPPAGELTHWLLKDDKERRIEVVPPRTKNAQHARLSYRTLNKHRRGTLVEIELHTGRKHQIRVQLAEIGCPIVGDRKYGSRQPLADMAIALHAVRLTIEHPTTRQPLTVESPLPENWNTNPKRQRGNTNPKR
ncbi:MAG TPA: RluA family pseudouridine synthase [Pirellulaceae bacterium]|nr:RluA family pseudouridine synthase [Pirellulaceae bacterium]